MTRPRTPASAMTTSLPRPRTTCGMPAAPGELDERPQLERVVGHGEQVGRAADAHRGEPGERLVARRLDPDPALDLGPERDRVERRGAAPAIASSPGVRAASCRELPRAALDRRPGPAAAGARRRPGRARRRRRRRPAGRARAAAAAIRAWRAGSSRIAAASSRAAASNASSSMSQAGARPRPAVGRSPAGGRPRAGTGTTTSGMPSAVASASVELPARPTIEVGGDQGGGHLGPEERVRPVARRARSAGSASRPASASA